MTLEEAAARLGLASEAVRKRVARGTLAGRRVGRRLLVTLPDDAGEAPDAPADADRTPTGRDRPRPDSDRTPLEAHLEAEVLYLRAQLEDSRRAEAELRRVIAGLVGRLPELAPPTSVASRNATPSESDEETPSILDEVVPPERSPAPPGETMQPTRPEPETPPPAPSSGPQEGLEGAGEAHNFATSRSSPPPPRPWWRFW